MNTQIKEGLYSGYPYYLKIDLSFKNICKDMDSVFALSIILNYYDGTIQSDKLVIAEDDVWIAKKREEWSAELHISPKKWDRILKGLCKSGLVEKKLKLYNNSPIVHIKPSIENIIEQLEMNEGE